MTVDDLVDYIEPIAGCQVITYLPDEVDNVVMARFTGGPRDEELLALRQPKFQVFIRDKDDAKAEQLAVTLEQTLHGARGVQIGNYTCSIFSLNEPYSLGKDSKERYQYSLNFELIYQT